MTEEMKPVPEHPATNVLRSFFNAMNAWEWDRIRESRDIPSRFRGMKEEDIERGLLEIRAAARARLGAIFDEFCAIGSAAKRVNNVIHYGAEEPDYNSEKEQVLSVVDRGDRVIIETQMTHQLRNRLKYELINMNGGWKIRDNRKSFAEHSKKWLRMDL